MGVGLAMSAIGGGGFVFLAKAAGKAALRGTITRALSRGLARFLGNQLANKVVGTVLGVVLQTGGYSVGAVGARLLDGHDRHRNNGWWDI
ncbi:hypothetical protein [Lactococcus cremoris]|uniref:hypothetical protein n=1 Tax=Lactococcus lactis subsp. cremoris TaxID=1359 RepID=UPI0003AB82D3|nr:hypothetical protein [Lactococcus cremoris]AGV72773.1 hypothetical protein kw2_0813 [Lactococcus cremoris subsp. cremoris KW2]